jgi:hypothetical protein
VTYSSKVLVRNMLQGVDQFALRQIFGPHVVT